MQASWPVVGRQAELGALADALDDPECGGVALVGAAGVGKTRLSQEVLALARARTLDTCALRATSSASAVPFAALAPLLDLLDVPLRTDSSLFRAVSNALDAREEHLRLVLVVDDAQELDNASVTLLDQLTESAAVFVVLTVRHGDPEAFGVLEMWKDQRIRRIQIDPLDDDAVRELASVALAGAIDSATLRYLVTSCAGNVLFLRELLQDAIESGTLVRQYGMWRITGSLASSARLRDLIELRLEGLSGDERTALELVSLGDPLPLSLLASISPIRAAEELEERGLLITEDSGRSRTVRLTHPLHGEVIRAHLPTLRRERLSRALADALEEGGALDTPELLRAAVWRLDGGGGGRVETVVAAARAAFNSQDYELAARLGEAGWREWQCPDAALVVGEAFDFLGRAEDADVILEQAARLATTDRQTTSVAVRHAAMLFRSLNRADDATRVVAAASAKVREQSCRRELDALRGDHLLLSGQVARAIELDRPLLDGPVDAAFAQASLDVGTALALAGRTEAAIAHTAAALEARRDLEDVAQLSVMAVYVVGQSLAQCIAGRLAEAGATAEVGHAIAVDRRVVDGQAWFASVLGLIRLAQGRLRSSMDLFREVATTFGQLSHPGRRWGLGGLALAAGQLGDSASCREAIAELDALGTPTVRLMDVHILRGRAWAALASHSPATARSILWDAVELAEEWGQLASAVEALHDLARVGHAETVLDRLVALEGAVDGDLMAARIAYARAAAHHELELADEAAGRFEDCGALLFAAEAVALAQKMAARAGLRRRAAADGVRIETLLAQCEGAVTPGLHGTEEAGRLSPRELEVAQCALEGLSNREISEKLFVSKRTVDNHLQRIYAKLGVTSRAELRERLDT